MAFSKLGILALLIYSLVAQLILIPKIRRICRKLHCEPPTLHILVFFEYVWKQSRKPNKEELKSVANKFFLSIISFLSFILLVFLFASK
jgi:preprotein translocase subunit Sss1